MQTQARAKRPASVLKDPVPKAAPVTSSLKPPFFFLDRNHLMEALGKAFASLRKGLTSNRVALARIAAALIVVYVIGVLLFWSRFLPGTRVDGVPASFKTPAAVAAAAKDKAAGFSLTVEGQGVDLTFTGEDVGLTFDEEAFAAGAARQTPAFAWPVALLTSHDHEVSEGVSFDGEIGRAHV